MSSPGSPSAFHKSRSNAITLSHTSYTSHTSPVSSPVNRLSSHQSSRLFRPVKTPLDHQANIQALRDYSLGLATVNIENSFSTGVPQTRPQTSTSSNLVRRKKIVNPTDKFYIKPGIRQLKAFEVSELFRRKKKDCCLSNVLSYSKEEIRKNNRSGLSPEHFSMMEEKERNIKSMMSSLFLRKEGPNVVKTPSNFKSTQASPNITFSEGFSAYTNNKKVLLHSSSMKTPKSSYYGITNSPYNISPFPHFSSEEVSNIAHNMNQQEDNFVHMNNTSVSNMKTRNQSAKERPKILSRKGSNPGCVNKTSDSFNKSQKVLRPNTAKISVVSKRPQTASSSHKLNTGLLRLNPKLSCSQRERLDAYLGANFQNGLVYNDSMANIEKDEVQMNTFSDVKNYLLEKEQVGDRMHKVLEEYKKKIHKTVINNPMINISANKSQEEVRIDMPGTVNFEIMSPTSSYALKSALYKNVGKETKLEEEKREHLKKFLAKYEIQCLSEFRQNTAKDIKNSKISETNHQNEHNNRIRNKIHRAKKIKKALASRLKRLAKLGLSLKEIVEKKIIPSQPYEKKGSEAFIKAVKNGDYEVVESCLESNEFYVFEFDSAKQTALHWSAKRGYLKICQLLLDYGAEVNAQDLTSRTPLFYALREGNHEIVRLLLVNKADPWSTKTTHFKSVCKDHKCLRYLNKARKLYIMMAFQTYHHRDELWNREADNMLAPIAEAILTTQDL